MADDSSDGEGDSQDTELDTGDTLWLATVIALYDFEHAAIGDTCTVSAHTAFDAWRKAEPLLGVAKEHLMLERVDGG